MLLEFAREIPLALPDEFENFGFLCAGATNKIDDLRLENAEWFKLAEDVNAALMQTADSAMRTVKDNLFTPSSIAVRILLRSCGAFQAIVLLTERGMVAEGRILVRTLIENGFCVAAIFEQPEKFVEMLKEDSEASRQRQRKFIIAKQLIDEGASRDKLQEAIDKFRKLSPINFRSLAELGPLEKHYLGYQRFSDDSAHLTARSLDRHVLRRDFRYFQYRWCIGDQGQNSATLHHAILTALGIGIGVTQILGDTDNNAEFGNLAQRFEEMPPVPRI